MGKKLEAGKIIRWQKSARGENKRQEKKARIQQAFSNVTNVGGIPAILRILRNEKYCGDVLMQKTFTLDCLTHKKIKNTGQRPKYLLKGGIPAIIAQDKWQITQRLLKERRFFTTHAGKPDVDVFISRVKASALRGFVYINPNWRNKEIDRALKN